MWQYVYQWAHGTTMGQKYDKYGTVFTKMWHKYDTWDKNVEPWLPNVSTMWQKYDKWRTLFTNVTQGTSWTKRQRNLMKNCQSEMMAMLMIMVMMINKMMVIFTSRRWWSRRWWSCWSLLASLQSQPSKPNFSYMYYIHTGWASKNLLRLKSTCLYSFWKI